METLKNPNIIFIVIDAGRADYFSCYAGSGVTTPNIDRIAKGGALFENVISTAPWTIPSHGTMFTGLYPFQHQATWETLCLKAGIPTIFDIFTQRGYAALAVSANSLIVSPHSMFGKKTRILGNAVNNDPDISSFAKDFDYRNTDSQSIAGRFIKYLDEHPQNVPQIMYLNFYDLHAKYKAREPYYSNFVNAAQDKTLKASGDFYSLHFKEMNDELEVTVEMISALRASYTARLAMIDSDIGRVLEKLKEHKLLDNAIVVITADHGDVLGDHTRPSFHHQFSIYNSLLKIPLIFSCQGINGPKRINVPLIQNTDILPTILELCGIKMPEALSNSPGVSLSSYIFNDRRDLPRRYALSMYESPLRFILRNKKKVNAAYLRNLSAIQDAEYKLILSDKGQVELYHLSVDALEKENIASGLPGKVQELKEAFFEIVHRYTQPEGGFSDFCYNQADEQKMIQRLKALGYIE
ncbi:MAG: sulfatase [Candidatus Omnitrophota bacterium]